VQVIAAIWIKSNNGEFMQTQSFDMATFQTLVANVYDMSMRMDNREAFLERVADLCGVSTQALFDGGIAESLMPNAMLSALLPHIEQAVNIGQRFRQADHLQQMSMQLLDNLSCGVILFSDDGIPRVYNRIAERLCADAALGITLDDKQDLSTLPAMLSQAIRNASPTYSSESKVSAFHLGEGDDQLSVFVSPMSQLEAFRGTDQTMIAVCISKANVEETGMSSSLVALFGLSRAETRLVNALLDGDSIEQAAEKFFVSKNTLRVQLRSVFRKTQTRNQADLMRRILNLPLKIKAA